MRFFESPCRGVHSYPRVSGRGREGWRGDCACRGRLCGEFHYDQRVQPLPKLGSHVADLDRLLEENERRPRRERLTLMRLWEE
jgi:hypothetical protein